MYIGGLTDGTHKVRGRQRTDEEKVRARELAYKVVNDLCQRSSKGFNFNYTHLSW